MMANKMKVGIIGNYLIGGPTIAVELYGAHFSLTTEDARALAEALLHVTTEAAPSTKDALIDRALTEALDAIEDVQLKVDAALAKLRTAIRNQEVRDAE